MDKETIALRARLLADPNVFDLNDAIKHLNNDFTEETLVAVLDREDFDWMTFFSHINTSVIESAIACFDELLLRLEKVDVLTLIKVTELKNLSRIWRLIIRRKNEIPFKKSPEFVSGLFVCPLITSDSPVFSFEKIITEYYSGLKDTKTIIGLVRKIDLVAAKKILLRCDGMLDYINNSSAKEAVEIGVLFDLPSLWNELLLRDDVTEYIHNEMPTSDIFDAGSTSSVMYTHCRGSNITMNDVIEYAKKTNFKDVWQFVIEKEFDPKALLAIIPILPENYLKTDAMNKDSLVHYIKTLGYGTVTSLLAKTSDVSLFNFILKNTVVKVSVIYILELSKKFAGQNELWDYLLNRDDVKKHMRSKIETSMSTIVHVAKKYQCKSFWNFIVTEADIQKAILIVADMDNEDLWKQLFARQDFQKDDLPFLLGVYKSTNNPAVWNMVLSFECVQNYCNKQ